MYRPLGLPQPVALRYMLHGHVIRIFIVKKFLNRLVVPFVAAIFQIFSSNFFDILYRSFLQLILAKDFWSTKYLQFVVNCNIHGH